jgi:hypothetical protein
MTRDTTGDTARDMIRALARVTTGDPSRSMIRNVTEVTFKDTITRLISRIFFFHQTTLSKSSTSVYYVLNRLHSRKYFKLSMNLLTDDPGSQINNRRHRRLCK